MPNASRRLLLPRSATCPEDPVVSLRYSFGNDVRVSVNLVINSSRHTDGVFSAFQP